jgi:hypothetical protein
VARVSGPRSRWLTLPLHALLVVVLVLDVRAAVFWAGVGGSLGVPVALAAAGVAVLAGVLLAVDVRRQVVLGRLRRPAAPD